MSEQELRQEINGLREMLTSNLTAQAAMAADIAVIRQQVLYGDKRMSELQCSRHQATMTDILVKIESFETVKKLAYGAVGLSLTSIGGAIMMQLMKH